MESTRDQNQAPATPASEILILYQVEGMEGQRGRLTHVYARDEEHARQLTSDWRCSYPHLSSITYTPCPEGFGIVTTYLPGTKVMNSE
ncbi:MAG: hypothetical protein J2P36_18670 [Ktedonobacteraceae bacterium]|nr:hypothetical protein [Ktedonobacteraceae bacterium]